MGNYKYFLKKITQLNNEVLILELADISGRAVFNYKPGQYAMISYLDELGKIKQRHAFSIASSPSQNNSLIFGIKMGGAFTRGLLNLKMGAPLSVAGPYGNFVFKPKRHKDLVMLAGGIGITPFLSAMTYATDNNLDNKLALLYSARTLNNASFLNQIKQLEAKNPNLRTLLSITNEIVPANTPGVINERINSQIIKDFVGELNNKTFFICGPADFMDSVKNNLLSLGVYKSQIEMEAFSMLDGQGLWPQFKNLSYATGLSAAAVVLIFYSIVNAEALTKSLKSATGALNPNSAINSTQSNYQTETAPTPLTSVSGVPVQDTTNNSTAPTSSSAPTNNNWTNSPQPTTSTSIPVQIQTQSNSTINRGPVNSINNSAVAPAPATYSSTPIRPNTINNNGYTSEREDEDDD